MTNEQVYIIRTLEFARQINDDKLPYVKSAYFEEKLHLSNREVRQCIHDIIKDKEAIILSGDLGFFIPETFAECDHAIARLKSMGVEIMDRARILEEMAIEKFGDQGILF